jgi:hypothetical protein
MGRSEPKGRAIVPFFVSGGRRGEQARVAQQVIVTATAGKAAAVKEFQNLHRDFAAGTQLVAEVGGAGAASGGAR